MNGSHFRHHCACACVLARPTIVTLLTRESGARLVKINMTDTEKKRDALVLIAVDDVLVTLWVKLSEAYVKRGGRESTR